MERYLLKRILLASVIWSSFCATVLHAQELSQEIASAFGYPHERLTVTDRSSEYAEKSKGDYLYGVQLTSKDGTFASMDLAVSKRGRILKPEFEEYCEEHPDILRRFELAGGGYGYAGVGMGGPGGSEERTIATWPERGIDLLVKIKLLRDGLAPDDTLKDYQSLVSEGGSPLNEKMIASLNLLADYAEKEKLVVLSGSVSNSSAHIPSKFDTRSESSKSTSSPEPSREGEAQSGFPIWIWAAIAILLCLFLGVVFKRRA